MAKLTRRNLLKKAAVAAPGAVAGGALLTEAARAAERSPAAGKNLVIFITDQERAVQHFPKGWEEQNLPGLTRLKRNGGLFQPGFFGCLHVFAIQRLYVHRLFHGPARGEIHARRGHALA